MPVARRDLKEAGGESRPRRSRPGNRIEGPGLRGEPAKYGEARKLPGRGGGYMEASGW